MKKRNNRNYGYIPKNQPKREWTSTPLKKNTPPESTIKRVLLQLGKALLFLLYLPIRIILALIKKGASNASLRKKLFQAILGIGVVGFVGILILFAWASKDLPDPDKLTDRHVAQSTKIYDRTGEHLLYEIFSDKKRTLVELEDIPQHVIDGVIATEDTAFYEHKGIRPLSIARSFVYGILGQSRIGGGASTLTQQLVKNAILTTEQTVSRKAKEIILSIRLEQKYSKDQILKIYFNEIPYGSTNYGIESASQSYFGKHVSDLTLAESATLAGFPKAPTRYLNNPEALKTRRDFVLARMYAEGYITEEEKNAAQQEPLVLQKNYGAIHAPHFVLYVQEQLVAEYGEQLVDAGGLRVITSLDWNMQQAAEEAVKEESEKLFEAANANNTGLVAMNPKNGNIMAFVGSRDFADDTIDGKFDVIRFAKRQPGSSFKPIIYTAAFEKGYTPDTILFDVETNFDLSGTKPYIPKNYDLQERGPVTMRQALQGSLNIPAVKALYLVGEKPAISFAEKLGYTTLSNGNFGLSLVLGGGEVTPLEHVRAFGVFANQGIKQEIVSILKVSDKDGSTLYEWKEKSGERVLDADVAATISNVLSDDPARAYTFGSDGVLTLPGRPVAAKTGTTNNYVDAWTVGYTPSLVAGVWAGNTDNTPMTRGDGGSRVAAPIWNHFMKKALEGSAVESFPPLPEPKTNKPALRGSTGGSVTLRVNKITGNLANSSTPAQLIVDRTYTQAHDILHYVQKDDPQGAIPENPGSDPHYQVWEDAIKQWIERKRAADPNWEIVFEEPPTREDDEYSMELIPTLEIVYPTPSTTFTSQTIITDIRASAPRGIDRVTYKIDEIYAGVEYEHPFNLQKELPWLTPGNHILTVIVQDDLGNRVEASVPIIVDFGSGPPEFQVLVPTEL